MAARTLSQILSELAPTYNPQIKAIQKRQALIPQQIASEEAGLGAKQTEAFDSILGGARRRGLGFSGIPLGEQARYTATEYLPALARLRQSGQEQALSLQDAILGINERKGTLAQQLYQQEQDRAFQSSEAEKNRRAQLKAAQAAASSAFSPTYGGQGGASQGPKLSAIDFAKLAKSKLQQAGNIQPFAREAVRDQLMEQYGLSQNAANKIIYNQIFPDNWESPYGKGATYGLGSY